ncbi:MAG: sugar transferase [Bacteroidota bacterium]
MYRIRDIILSLILFMALLPAMGIIVLLLSFTQKRIFFFQRRPGLHEKPFLLIKFSTLHDLPPGMEETGKDLNERLTPVGKYLRKLSLDELPQLWNVLKGEMSLVGPRPLLMEYLPLYAPEDRIRHQVRPGITGWAQVNGRNALSFKARFAHDRWYVANQSMMLDGRILWMTLGKVFRRKDVYQSEGVSSPKFDGTN